ncbi:MAG TPA: hypothetical protein VFU98_16700, partial [Microlunatus sp.]|nr:hypothetical protein [Microlunatus sp.]
MGIDGQAGLLEEVSGCLARALIAFDQSTGEFPVLSPKVEAQQSCAAFSSLSSLTLGLENVICREGCMDDRSQEPHLLLSGEEWNN